MLIFKTITQKKPFEINPQKAYTLYNLVINLHSVFDNH